MLAEATLNMAGSIVDPTAQGRLINSTEFVSPISRGISNGNGSQPTIKAQYHAAARIAIATCGISILSLGLRRP